MPILMPLAPPDRPRLGCLAFRQRQIAREADPFDIVIEGQPRFQMVAQVQHMHPETRVAHDEHLVRTEKRKPLLHRLDRIGEVATGGLGFLIGLGKPRVRLVQKVQRTLQIAGARADLILQHRGALKLGIGRAAVIGGLLHPSHQRLGNGQKLIALPFRRVCGVQQA